MITNLLNILVLFMLFLISYYLYLNYNKKELLIISLFWIIYIFSYIFKFIGLITELKYIYLIFLPIGGFLLLNLFYKSSIPLVITTLLAAIWPLISQSQQKLLPYGYLAFVFIFVSIKINLKSQELKILTAPFLGLGLIYIINIFNFNYNQLILAFHILILGTIIILIFNKTTFKKFRNKKKIFNDKYFIMINLFLIIISSLFIWCLIAFYTYLPQKIISWILFNSYKITYITGVLIYTIILYIILSLLSMYWFKKRFYKIH